MSNVCLDVNRRAQTRQPSKPWIVFLFQPKSSCTLEFFFASSLYSYLAWKGVKHIVNKNTIGVKHIVNKNTIKVLQPSLAAFMIVK
jgi:hypothetical protein